MKLLILGIILFSFTLAQAQEDCADKNMKEVNAVLAVAKAVTEENECPNKSKLRIICNLVSTRTKDNTPNTKLDHSYQRAIYSAACAKDSDSEAETNKKIQEMWSKFEKDLVCDSPQFDVRKGSLLKFAVSNNFDDFIYDVVDWKVNLNRVDDADGRTVLDYIKHQMERSKNNILKHQKLKEYYDELRSAGAKHKSEL